MDFLELGETVRILREEQKVTQKQMAEHLAISRATLSAFENGRAGDIGIKKVMLMLDYLGYQLRVGKKSRLPTFEELKDANRR